MTLDDGLVRPGVVHGIERHNRRLRAIIDGDLHDDITYDARNPPWPFARAWFRGGPPWHCIAPVGHRRVLFHDDFTTVASGSPVAGDLVGTDANGWRVAVSAGTLTVNQSGTGIGGMRLESSGFANAQVWMGRDADALALNDGDAFLFSVRFSYEFPGTEPTKWFPGVCLETTGAEPDTPGLFAASPNSAFRIQGTETAAAVLDGTTPAEAEFFVADFIYTSSSVIGWVNGNGPSAATTVSMGAFAPYIGFCTVGGQLVATFDWATCSVVTLGYTPDL